MMKSEPRPFASLSSGLLARKGAARPAMRPQGFGQGGSGLDDLGWNDMGFEPPKAVLVPVDADFGDDVPMARPTPMTGLTPSSPVHAVHEQLEQRLGQDVFEDEEIDETAEPVPADAPPLEVVLAPVAAIVVAPAPAPVAAIVMAPATAPVAEIVVAAVPAAPHARSAVPTSRRAVGAKAKAAFTLRLDGERHLKLRLACAVTGVSAQQLVTRALDTLLGTMPELEAMAKNAPELRSSKG